MSGWLKLLFLLIGLIAANLSADLPAYAGKRVALVVGNSGYLHTGKLPAPAKDAKAIAKLLSGLGFQVVLGTDLSHRQFGVQISRFRNALAGADVALFYYSGLGLQVAGRNFLLPVDARLVAEDRLDFEAIRLRTLLKVMQQRASTSLVFLDASRDTSLATTLASGMADRSTPVRSGLAVEDVGAGQLLISAAQPGQLTPEEAGEHSVFASAILKHIQTPGLDMAAIVGQIRTDVVAGTSDRQTPWIRSSLSPFVTLLREPGQPPATADGGKELTLALQKELKRLGCNPGQADGIWGRKAKAALAVFNRHTGLGLPTGQPTEKALEAMKSRAKRVCPALPVAKRNRTAPAKKKSADQKPDIVCNYSFTQDQSSAGSFHCWRKL